MPAAGAPPPAPLPPLPAPVGSYPAGVGRFGQLDLAGSVEEWTLDAVGPRPIPCNDCASVDQIYPDTGQRSDAAKLVGVDHVAHRNDAFAVGLNIEHEVDFIAATPDESEPTVHVRCIDGLLSAERKFS